MKRDVAFQHGVGYMCSLMTGIFTRIVFELAYENFKNGNSIDSLTPFWRVVNLKIPIARKLSFKTDFLKEMRARKGLSL